jgi:glutamate-1-semialdehyde 2,1-aminomutase
MSKELYDRAVRVLPNGVTRPFRFFEPYPFYGKKAYGSKLVDFEDRVYTDYWQGHGGLVLGHLHPSTINAVKEQLELGFHLGVCNEWEVKLAEQVSKLVPSVEMITWANSGTEANLIAIKLARAYAKRDKIGKFEGHFHGIVESLYIATGLGGLADTPDSAGHDPVSAKNTVVLRSHNEDAYKTIKKESMACVIIELVSSASCVPEDKEFVKGLREVCDETGTLLIIDEVVTGFRLAPGGAQEVWGVTPDITTFGKAIAGGEFGVGAVGGKREIMELMNCKKYPKALEHVSQGGTYVGNPLSMRAGYAATKVYQEGSLYKHLNKLGQKLIKGLQDAAEHTQASAHVTGIGSLVKLHFLKPGTAGRDLRSLKMNADLQAENKYFHHLLSNGIFAMIPNEVHFYVCLPHTEQEIDELISASRNFLESLTPLKARAT